MVRIGLEWAEWKREGKRKENETKGGVEEEREGEWLKC